MFDNDVTMTYNHQDATLEILLMLAGAFLLGMLLSWLLSKLFKKRKRDNYSSNFVATTGNSVVDKNSQANMSNKARVINTNSDTAYTSPKFDDLTKISGIDTNVQSILKDQGINSYTDLRDVKKNQLQKIQNDALSNSKTKRKIVETWPHQASLAAKGEWKKLDEYQQFIDESDKEKTVITKKENDKKDDLKLIEGIGPKIEGILRSKGINSFKQLSEADSLSLKKYITDADSRFEKNETESWPHQAAMAEKGQWEELNIYQEFMHSDSEPDKQGHNAKVQSLKDEDVSPEDSDQDDLKKIEGIGPKIENLLNKSGIYTFSQLKNSNRDRLKSILMTAGSQFRMHEPESWPHQAELAHNNEWDKLKTFQDNLNSNSKKLNNEKTIAKDDLKKIEGIGPKLQELLNSLDIYTYSDLSKADSNEIQKVLDKSGPQYRVHEPKTWPAQAKLAANNKWDELEKMQQDIVKQRSIE